MAIIHIDRHNNIVDGRFRPLATCPTVADAARWLSRHDAELPLYVEARFSLYPGAPVSIDKQMATKIRRLKAIGRGCGRILSRVDAVPGMTHYYTALLAR